MLDFVGSWKVIVRDGRTIEVNITVDLPAPELSNVTRCESASITADDLTRPLDRNCGVGMGKFVLIYENLHY